MNIQGNVVEEIIHNSKSRTRITFHLDRQREIGRSLDKMIEEGSLGAWTWLYTDKRRAYYLIEKVLYDTAMAEAFLHGAIGVKP